MTLEIMKLCCHLPVVKKLMRRFLCKTAVMQSASERGASKRPRAGQQCSTLSENEFSSNGCRLKIMAQAHTGKNFGGNMPCVPTRYMNQSRL